MADELTDPRRNPVPCPERTCIAGQGDMWCYTATGFRRHWHVSRRRLALGQAGPEKKKPSGTGRPSHKQADMLAYAIATGGTYEVSGYTFNGEAQKRAAMNSMVARGWFRRSGSNDHGTLYEVTDDGKAASARYENWLNGGTT